jgi:hypothetical protein
VPDPCRLYTDMDPRLHTTRLRIRILPLSSAALPKKNKFIFYFFAYYLGTEGTFTAVFSDTGNKYRN